jgi:hypothetical protein
MARKLHPADAANAAIIANAVRFDLALFLGVGRYARASAHTLADARAEAQRLAALHPNGRRALIYAIDVSGRSALVTDDIPTEEKESAMKTYAKKFNAQRAAKAAGHKPDEVEIIKTKDGFTFRVKTTETAPKRDKTAKAEVATETSRKAAAQPEAAATRPRDGKRAVVEAAAREGKLLEPPDFSAETHKRFRPKLAKLTEMAKAGDIEGLKAMEINPVSTSPRAMQRYRDLCVIALEAGRIAA